MQSRLLILISLISVLSITGLYAYAASLDVTILSEVEDDGDKMLGNPMDAAVITIGDSTYVVVSSQEDGIEIIDISDPTNPTSVGRLGDDGTRLLAGAKEIGIYTISGSTYAVVTSGNEDGIQIIDISDPTNPTPVGNLADNDGGLGDTRELAGAKGIAIETINGVEYAIVTGNTDDGIEIIDISDPTNPTSVGSLSDDNNKNGCDLNEVCLDHVKGVRTTTINDKTYAIISGQNDDGIEIIDISNPTNPTSVSRVVDDDDANNDGRHGTADVCTVANGQRCLDGVRQIAIAEIGGIGDTSGTHYVITAGRADNGIDVIDISDPENPTYLLSVTDDDPNCGTGGDGSCELDGPSYIAPITTIGTSTYVIVTGQDDNGIQIIRLCENCEIVETTSSTASTSTSTSSFCVRHVILGNCGTIAINNDAYHIIDPWSIIPTTEVMVGEPVTITLSTPHNYAAAKINSASVYTEIFSSPANYEESTRIYYAMNGDHYVSDHATQKQLFQVAGATHRISQDTDVKNLKLFEVVFTMVFAKPMDTSYVIVETENVLGVPETIYLGNALKVIERPIELLTYEEKSKFEIISEPELKASPSLDMDIEPDMDMLSIDPEPVSKVTCGNGTMVKNNICVVDETSFYFFINQFMRLFG